MKLTRVKSKGAENLYRDPKTEIIYYRQYRAGKGRCERSTFTTNLTEAKRIADDYRMEFLGETKIKRGKALCGELFPAFIDQKRIKRKGTVKSIEYVWTLLKPHIENLLPEEITGRWWETEYIPARRASNPTQKFFNQRKVLAMFLLNLKREGLLNDTPRLINPDPEIKAGRVFTHDELKALLANGNADMRLQILMAVTMGMRKSEILKLSWDRVDLERRTITLRAQDTKVGKARTFGISDVVLTSLVAREKGSPYVFPHRDRPEEHVTETGNQTAWDGCRNRAKVDGRFHDLRHTFLTNAFRSREANPALICFYAGLSLEMAQAVYLHFDVEDTRLVASIGGKLGESLISGPVEKSEESENA